MFSCRHGVKVGPGSRDLAPQDAGTQDSGPPQSLKVGPGTPSKFKSGTRDPPKGQKWDPRTPFEI